MIGDTGYVSLEGLKEILREASESTAEALAVMKDADRPIAYRMGWGQAAMGWTLSRLVEAMTKVEALQRTEIAYSAPAHIVVNVEQNADDHEDWE